MSAFTGFMTFATGAHVALEIKTKTGSFSVERYGKDADRERFLEQIHLLESAMAKSGLRAASSKSKPSLPEAA